MSLFACGSDARRLLVRRPRAVVMLFSRACPPHCIILDAPPTHSPCSMDHRQPVATTSVGLPCLCLGLLLWIGWASLIFYSI